MAVFGHGFRLLTIAIFGYAVFVMMNPDISNRPLAQVTLSQIGQFALACLVCFGIGRWAIDFPEDETAKAWGGIGIFVIGAIFLAFAIMVSR